jgi:hypothetical protein
MMKRTLRADGEWICPTCGGRAGVGPRVGGGVVGVEN